MYLEAPLMQKNFSLENALEPALASTKMEGFEVTEQTRRDCLRLINGEVTIEELVREISSRVSEEAE